ncbi:hypothetical protein BDQ17DRAFT_1432898 [Cyathus striatus]|nr:hypothetical protein BDQ17DRAFT_1432898 [Cyathus striatus]
MERLSLHHYPSAISYATRNAYIHLQLKRSQIFRKVRCSSLPPLMGTRRKEPGVRMTADGCTGSLVQAKATTMRSGGIGGFNDWRWGRERVAPIQAVSFSSSTLVPNDNGNDLIPSLLYRLPLIRRLRRLHRYVERSGVHSHLVPTPLDTLLTPVEGAKESVTSARRVALEKVLVVSYEDFLGFSRRIELEWRRRWRRVAY